MSVQGDNRIYRIYSFCSPGPYFFQPNSLPGPYSSTGACYFQSKIMHKNYLWRQIFHDINPFSMSIYSRQTQIIHIHIFTRFLFPIVLYHWKISFYIGRVFKHGPLFIFIFCSHGRLFKQALNQDRAVKRVYTVIGIESMKSEILFRVNVNNANKGDDVQYSITRLSGRSKGNRTKL